MAGPGARPGQRAELGGRHCGREAVLRARSRGTPGLGMPRRQRARAPHSKKNAPQTPPRAQEVPILGRSGRSGHTRLRKGCAACFSAPGGGGRRQHSAAPEGARARDPQSWQGGGAMLARRPPPANTLCHTTLGPASRPVPAPGSSTGESRPSVPPAFHAGPASDKQAQAALSPTAAPAPSPPASALQSSSKKEPPTPRDPKAWQLQGTPKAWEGNHPPEDCVSCGGLAHSGAQRTGPAAPRCTPRSLPGLDSGMSRGEWRREGLRGLWRKLV